MSWTHILSVVLLCSVTGSYTWGMRGTILGGERGAMLPGAALALVMLHAGGVMPLSLLYPTAAAAGAIGMFFGGSQTYGETISKTHAADDETRLFGRLGIMVKGAGWFGVFGGILAFTLAALSGRYPTWAVALFTALIPCVKWLGILLLNRPMKREQNRFPKIYFSESRTETWGGMILLCAAFAVFAAARREWLMLLLTAAGMFFGGFGFFLGNLFQTALNKHRANEKNLFSRMRRCGVLSAWKGMECIFGAVGGAGMGLCWCLLYTPFVRPYADAVIAHSGAWDAFSDKADNIMLFVWLLLFMLFVARYAVRSDSGRAFSRFVYGTEDIWIWPVFCYVPLFLICCGNLLFAQVFSVTVLLFLIADKIAFAATERFETIPGAKALHCIAVLLPAATFCVQIFTRFSFGMYATFATYILSYLLTYAYTVFAPLCAKRPRARQDLRAGLSWSVWALLCAAVLLAAGVFYFPLPGSPVIL